MKKLNLEMLRLTSADVLERSQMKKITGGYRTGNLTGCNMWSCNTGFGCYQSNCRCHVDGSGVNGICVSVI
jgi:hypothetical protein